MRFILCFGCELVAFILVFVYVFMENVNGNTVVKEKVKRSKYSVGDIISTGKGAITVRLAKNELKQLVDKHVIKSSDFAEDVYTGVCHELDIIARVRNLGDAFTKLGTDGNTVLEYLKKNPKTLELVNSVKRK